MVFVIVNSFQPSLTFEGKFNSQPLGQGTEGKGCTIGLLIMITCKK
jgi:hypothetical protein